jgi:hypothetical protein
VLKVTSEVLTSVKEKEAEKTRVQEKKQRTEMLVDKWMACLQPHFLSSLPHTNTLCFPCFPVQLTLNSEDDDS